VDTKRIIFLDVGTLGRRTKLEFLEKPGSPTLYDFTNQSEVPERIRDSAHRAHQQGPTHR